MNIGGFILDHEKLLLWGSALSGVAFVAAIIGVPWVVARLPRDYFNQPNRSVWRNLNTEPWYALALGGLKNLLGAVLLVLGVLMLVTPGQGLLTLIAGLLLMNFPGKYQLERWLVSQPGVMRGLNWLRNRRGEPPFEAPRPPEEGG